MTVQTYFSHRLKMAANASLAMLMLCFSPAALFAQEPELQAVLNPAFIKWQEAQEKRKVLQALGLPVEPLDPRLGYIPDPYLPPDVEPGRPLTQMEAMVKSGLAYYSPAFDLRPLGLVSDVKNQNPYGTCWAFSSIAALESSLRKSGVYLGDLSEWHLAYFTFNPINGIPGFTKTPSASFGDHETFDQGGNFSRAMSIMTRGALAGGPVSSESAPYNGPLPTSSEASIATIHRTYFVSSASNDAIKGLLEEYGVVAISMLWPASSIASTYYDSSTCAFRMVDNTTTNHGVNIVGWDDNFPKEKFPAGNQPSEDGAWIVRNSWGASWGDSGYFYMSYDSTVVSIGVYVGQAGADTKTYQYAMFPRIGGIGYGTSTCWFSNIFTADGVHAIKAVSFYSTQPGATYEIYVRKGVGSTPTDGGTVALGPQAGTLGPPGYHRVALNSPVTVTNGERFAVIVKLTDPGYTYPVSYTYANTSWKTEAATATPGVGFISSTGVSWSDITSASGRDTYSICLKAFADDTTVVAVKSLSLNKTATTLAVGASETLVATVLPTNAANLAVSWSSSNPSVATVTANGLVRGVSEGAATITATSLADSGISATCEVTVYYLPVASVTLNKATTALNVGAAETLVATVLPSNATNKAVNWATSDASVATVTGSGLVTAVAPGAATITATSQADATKSASCEVTVNSVPVSSVGLNKTTTTLAVGATETLVATVLPSNATNKNVNWASSDPSIATVSPSSLVAAVAPGSATITATSAADGTKSASCAVTVNPAVAVSISPKSVSLLANETQAFTATVTGTSNTAVTWSATGGSITQGGAYTAPAEAGTYTVTARSQADDTKYDTATVTVTAASIVFTAVPKALFVGESAQLATQAYGLADASVTWQASHGSVSQQSATTATYTAPGYVPPGDGRAAITATSAQAPSVIGQVPILIRHTDFARFGADNNAKASPQLLDLANAMGSTAQADLDKYDINGDGAIDDEDLSMLFKAMGW